MTKYKTSIPSTPRDWATTSRFSLLKQAWPAPPTAKLIFGKGEELRLPAGVKPRSPVPTPACSFSRRHDHDEDYHSTLHRNRWL